MEAAGNEGALARLTQTFRHEVLTNWRLMLLGITGLVLSLASGWTTWDGMTNFTRSPVLSMLITFGIQGIMLIAAWLIGETFAQSYSGKHSASVGGTAVFALGVFGILVISLLSMLLFGFFDANTVSQFDTFAQKSLNFASKEFWAIVVLVPLAGYAIYRMASSASTELIAPYARGIKTVLANLPLWLMFLACMATSVFFSFDSLFSTIFPAKERQRAAELRVRNEVAGVVADVGARIGQRRGEAVESLFISDAWKGFNTDLTTLVSVAQNAPQELTRMKLARVEAQSERESGERAALSSAQSEQATLHAEKTRLDAELAPVGVASAPAVARLAELDAELRTKREELIKAEADMRGEAEGVRGTGQAGRGPKWREARDRVRGLELDIEEIENRRAAVKADVDRIGDNRSVKAQRLKVIAARLAELDVQIAAAKERLATVQADGRSNIADDLDAAGGIRQLERVRADFRREPTSERLKEVQALCNSLRVTISQVPAVAAKTDNINCEPEAASEAAARVFGFDSALAAFRVECLVGEKIGGGTTNQLLKFGNACIQNSALPGADTEEFRTRLGRVALNRDDKAHRFVVTVNAFSDGNRLAYLALAIAIAIDALVFMSGLFGANAIRSPLSDAPITRRRTAAQLEDEFSGALAAPGGDRLRNAMLVLKSIRVNSDGSGFTGRVDLRDRDRDEAEKISHVLNTARGMELAAAVPGQPGCYLVRPQVAEFLNAFVNRIQKSNPAVARQLARENADADLRRQARDERDEQDKEVERDAARLLEHLRTAAEPKVFQTANSMLSFMRPLPQSLKADAAYANYTHFVSTVDVVRRVESHIDAVFEDELESTARVATKSALSQIRKRKVQVVHFTQDAVRRFLNVGAAENFVLHAHGTPEAILNAIGGGPANAGNHGETYFSQKAFFLALTRLRAEAAKSLRTANPEEHYFDAMVRPQVKRIVEQRARPVRQLSGDVERSQLTFDGDVFREYDEATRQEEAAMEFARLESAKTYHIKELRTAVGLGDGTARSDRIADLRNTVDHDRLTGALNELAESSPEVRDFLEGIRETGFQGPLELARKNMEKNANRSKDFNLIEAAVGEVSQDRDYLVADRIREFVRRTRDDMRAREQERNSTADRPKMILPAAVQKASDALLHRRFGDDEIVAELDVLPDAIVVDQYLQEGDDNVNVLPYPRNRTAS